MISCNEEKLVVEHYHKSLLGKKTLKLDEIIKATGLKDYHLNKMSRVEVVDDVRKIASWTANVVKKGVNMTNRELIDWLNFSDRLKFVNSAYYEKILQINDYEIDKNFNRLSKLGIDDATNFTFQYVIYKNYKLYGEEEHELALKEVYKLLKTIKKYLIARDINIDVSSLTSRMIEYKFNIRKALKFERIKSCDLTYKIKIDNNIFSIRANDMNRMIIESDSKALDNKYKYMPALIIIKNDEVIFIYDIMTKMEKYDLLLCTSDIASSYRSWIV